MQDDVQQHLNGWRVVRYMRRIESNRRKGRIAVEFARQANLANLVRYAKQRSPFWRKRLAHIDPARVDLRAIAPVDKHELMENADRAVTDPAIRRNQVLDFVDDLANLGKLYLDKYVVAHTSGSTGLRGFFISDIYGWEMAQALGLAGPGEVPIHLRDIRNVLLLPFKKMNVAAVIPVRGHYTSYLLPSISSDLKARFVKFNYIDILDPFSKIIRQVNELDPVALHSYPSMVDSLAYYQLTGHLKIRPSIVTVAAEPFTRDMRDRVRQAWPDAVITDIYASTEVPAIAKLCRKGRLHYWADWVIIENCDRYGNPVPDGRRGEKIFITNLFNYLQPLIRYEMTDAVRFHPDPCPCGHATPTLEIFGRTNQTLWIPNAVEKWISLLPTPILVAFMEVPGLRQYQIIQQEPRHLHVNFAVDTPGEEARVQAEIDRVFQQYLTRHGLGGLVNFSFTVVNEVPRDERSQKVLQIINKVGDPGRHS